MMSPIVPANVDNVTVCVTFSLGSPHPNTSINSLLRESALICEEYWPPVMMNLPVLMLGSKVESHCTVLRSDNCALGRSSGSHTITMEFIPNSLVVQVNFSSTPEGNFHRLSCTDYDETTIQEKVLHWGYHPGTALTLYCPVSW